MKKVLCLTESLISGGAERQLSYLAVSLKRKAYDVQVWTYYSYDFYAEFLKENNVTYRYIASATSPKRRIPVLINELKKHKPDILITYLDISCIIGCIYKLFVPNVKLIVSERNTTQHITFQDRVKFFLYRFADNVVPNSYSQALFIKNKYPNLYHKVRVITNFIDTEKFIRKSNIIYNHITRIIVVGRIMPQKNPITFMYALSKLKEQGVKCKVEWFGEAEDVSYGRVCQAVYTELKIEDCLVFRHPDSNIVDKYNENEVFCLPSLFEGFPNVICEAMSCGLPILCSNVCDNPYIVKEGVCGFLFDPNDVDSIVESIKRYISLSPDSKEKMSKCSREQVLSISSNDQFVNNYIRLFE